MKHFYTSVPDLSWVYPQNKSYGYDPPNHNTKDLTAQHCSWLKEIRLFVTSQNRILTLDDVKEHLKGKKGLIETVRNTIEFYEYTGLISYVPNYEGDELLFTNTKHFKEIWNT